jgi:peptidoglycan/xylan/chitin deacetylase (PgdA/CDA1 family)
MNKLTIVTYHFVREIKNSKYPKIKGLEFSAFKRQLDFLENNYKIIDVQKLLDFASSGKNLPENSCLLTFDDGYKDHIEYVLPELLKRKIQGSFFPTFGPIIERDMLDMNCAQFILACCSDYEELVNLLNQLCLGNGIDEKELNNFWDIMDTKEYIAIYGVANRFDPKKTTYIKRLLQYFLPKEVRTKISKILFKKYVGVDVRKFSEELYMSFDDIKKLVDRDMYVGGHGYNHLWMSKENRKNQEKEINLSLEFLKNVGASVKEWIMCYPHGDYNSETLDVLREKNCSIGLTSKSGLNQLNKNNLFELLRFDTNDFPQ